MITKKRALLVSPAIPLIAAVIAFNMMNTPKASITSTKKVSTIPQEVSASSPADTVTTDSPTAVSPNASSPTPAATTTPVVLPQYGEDPNNPGTFRVFDKTATLADAGINDPDALTLIDDLSSNWTYKSTSAPSLNLCGAYPVQKMAAAGVDYLDNPVTQLKWCQSYAIGSYGSWSAALEHFQQYHTI